MMPVSEYIEYWGSQNLLRYDAAVVNTLSISDESKEFLIEVGLPRGGMQFYFPLEAADATMPYVHTVCFDPERVPVEYRNLRLLGTRCLDERSPVHYGISEQEGGAVFAVRDRKLRDLEMFFVNSSVQQYAEFVLRLERWHNWFHAAYEADPDVDSTTVGKALARTLRAIDRQGFEVETESGMETELGAIIYHIGTRGQF